MGRPVIAVKAAVLSTLFLSLWAVVALSLRRFDALFGIALPEAGHLPGLVAMVLGALLGASCVVTFVKDGHGTPAPIDPPREFVATGPFRYCRNPMYLGGGFLLVGLAFWERSVSILGFAVLALSVVHLLVVHREEPGLRKRFGSTYADYCRAVPRWIPRIQR